MRAPRRCLIVGFLCLAVAGLGRRTVSAQGKGFVEGGGLLDVDPTQRSQTTTTSGVTIGAGVFMTPRFSLRLEYDLPDWHASDYAGRGRVASHIEEYSQREERRSPSVSLLLGYNIRPVRRFSIALIVGGTNAKRASRVRGFTERYTLEGALLEHYDFDRSYGGYDWLAVSFGADAAIAVTKHLAVVPQLRLHSYLYSEHTSLMFVRPRMSVRWQF
jgi:hypothetical protein